MMTYNYGPQNYRNEFMITKKCNL